MSIDRGIYPGLMLLLTLAGIGACTNPDTPGADTAHVSQSDSSAVTPPEQPPKQGAFVQCTEPRPQICTREYNPVCATLEGGGTQTYATGCTACADAKVTGYSPGACE